MTSLDDPTGEGLVWLVQNLSAFCYVMGVSFRDQQKRPFVIPDAVTALAEKRWAAKQAKDFAGADALRKELTAAGWSMLDGKDGYKLEPLKK